jgi:subtilase family serine protease
VWRWTVLLALFVGVVFSPAASTQERRTQRLEVQRIGGHDAVAREVLVKFRRPLTPDELARLGADTNSDLEQVGRATTLRLRSRSLSAARLAALLHARGDVAFAEPNYVIRLSAQPDDPSFPQLWGLRNDGQDVNGGGAGLPGADIGATEAWNLSTGSTATVVGVVDTGIDYTHPDLAQNMWSAPAPFTVTIGGLPIACPEGTHGFDAIAMTCNPMDDHNHGTHVAGTIGASGDNGVGVVGVNWTTQLMGLKFLDASGSGTVADAVKAIQFAIQVKQAFAGTGGADIRVLSNSWAGGGFSQALMDAVNEANAADMLFVAAAGNSSTSNDAVPTYPASLDAPNVVAVGATTNTDSLAWFSNYGAASVDLAAPGVDILSTTIGDTYAFASGTSMAAPHVSGAAALVLSQCALDTAQLKATLVGSTRGVSSLVSLVATGGRLDVDSAMQSCVAPPGAPANLTAVAGDGRVTLAWSSARGATSYTVKRSPTAGGPYVPIASGIQAARYLDSTVTNGTTYYYVASASNSLGESGDSNEAAATPTTPSDLVVSALSVPLNAGAGTTVVASVTTKNLGPGSTGASTTRLYLSADATLDASDEALASVQSVPSLAPGASSSASVPVTIPGELPVGERYLIARADADDLVVESSEVNNTQARFFYVGPDLIVASLSGPATAAAGATITLLDTVKNQGGGGAAGSVTRLYLSTNPTVEASDTLLGYRAVPALASNADSRVETQVTIPTTTAPGWYYVVAKTDADDLVLETQETNNVSARSIQIGADLIVTVVTGPPIAAPGATITVSDTTRNQGAGMTPPSVTRFYLSANNALDSGDVLLGGSRAVPALASAAASTGTTMLPIPSTTAAGTYYVIARADADEAVTETQETNNTAVYGLQIGTDLTPAALTVPAKAGAGSSILVTDTTTNRGTGVAPASVNRFYLSTNALLDAGDAPLGGSRSVPQLAAGASSTGQTSLAIPATTTAGFHYVIVKVDADNVVVETQEGNNTAARLVQIGADLVVLSITAPAAGAAGAPLTVSDTTQNQGGGTTATTATGFYFSTNTALDAFDLPLNRRTVAGLAEGASSAGSTTVTLPSGIAPGLYYLIAAADADNRAQESIEANNTLNRSIKIGPDLSISASAPFTVAAGGAITVNDVVTNVGGEAAAASTNRFYLSFNTSLDNGDTLLQAARTVPIVAAGSSSAASTIVTIPAATAPGNYVLLIHADGDGAVAEAQETNNLAIRALQVTASAP